MFRIHLTVTTPQKMTALLNELAQYTSEFHVEVLNRDGEEIVETTQPRESKVAKALFEAVEAASKTHAELEKALVVSGLSKSSLARALITLQKTGLPDGR